MIEAFIAMEVIGDQNVDRRPAFRNILKESLTLALRNPRYVLFVILIWSPLFFSTVVYEILFEKTWYLFGRRRSFNHFYIMRSGSYYLQENTNETAFSRYVYSCLLLLFVVHLVEFVISVITVNLASNLYTREGSELSLGEMISRPADAKRLNCSSLVSLYSTYLAVYVLRAAPAIWFLIGFESVIIYMLAMIVILQKYLEFFASWSTSVVVSLLEDVYGIDAVRLSFFFMNGSTRCGTYLMAVFFVLGTGLRIPLLLCFDGPRNGVIMLSKTGLDENAKLRGIARAGLLCWSNVIMWVVFVIYYHQCKKWVLEKKNDAVSQKNNVVPEKSNVASQKIDVESGGKVELNVNAEEKLSHIEA